ncbi:MAG: hypothetical protein AB1333_00835 [Patescibacteria group bacterium]
MSFKYYPYSEHICHHVYNKGGCTFCAFHTMKNCVSPIPVSISEQISHFDEFVNKKENREDIFKKKKILVETNGSWFVEVPKEVRDHIYRFVELHNLELHTQCRATLMNKTKTQKALEIMFRAQHKSDYKELAKMRAEEIFFAMDTEFKPYIVMFTGLEVANNDDLKIIHKECTLNDFIRFSKFVRSHGARVGANVLIGPPLVEDPVRKALETAQFALDTLEVYEVAFCACIPRLGAKSHNLWLKGIWNPVSPTECSEILRTTRKKYPERVVSLYSPRIHFFHGKYAKPNIKTEGQKIRARRAVRKIAREVFSV